MEGGAAGERDPAALERALLDEQEEVKRSLGQSDSSDDDVPIQVSFESYSMDFQWAIREGPFPKEAVLHHLVWSWAAKAPHAPAVSDENGVTVTYFQLWQRSIKLAAIIRRQDPLDGAVPDKLVAICVERNVSMIVSVLAVLEAGYGFVAVGLHSSAGQRRQIVEHSEAWAILVSPSCLAADGRGDWCPLPARATIVVSSNGDALGTHSPMPSPRTPRGTQSASTTKRAASSADVCCCYYTDGPHSEPQGVLIEHRNVVNMVAWLMSVPDVLVPGKALLNLADLTRAPFVTDLFWALGSGSRLHVASSEASRDGQHLRCILDREKDISVLATTPSIIHMLSASDWNGAPDLHVFCSGESVSPGLRGVLGRCKSVFNLYRVTETVGGTFFSGTSASSWQTGEQLPIGQTIWNIAALILDEDTMMPIPEGDGNVGTLFLGGAGITRGLLNQPEESSRAFVRNPHSDMVERFKSLGFPRPELLYNTGDYASRAFAGGPIVFQGRKTDFVTIGGRTVNLHEIEAVLERRSLVQRAVVIPRRDVAGRSPRQVLVAYVEVKRGYRGANRLAQAKLRSHIIGLARRELLSHSVPPFVVLMQPEDWKLTSAATVDRSALPAPEESSEVDMDSDDSSGGSTGGSDRGIVGDETKTAAEIFVARDDAASMEKGTTKREDGGGGDEHEAKKKSEDHKAETAAATRRAEFANQLEPLRGLLGVLVLFFFWGQLSRPEFFDAASSSPFAVYFGFRPDAGPNEIHLAMLVIGAVVFAELVGRRSTMRCGTPFSQGRAGSFKLLTAILGYWATSAGRVFPMYYLALLLSLLVCGAQQQSAMQTADVFFPHSDAELAKGGSVVTLGFLYAAGLPGLLPMHPAPHWVYVTVGWLLLLFAPLIIPCLALVRRTYFAVVGIVLSLVGGWLGMLLKRGSKAYGGDATGSNGGGGAVNGAGSWSFDVVSDLVITYPCLFIAGAFIGHVLELNHFSAVACHSYRANGATTVDGEDGDDDVPPAPRRGRSASRQCILRRGWGIVADICAFLLAIFTWACPDRPAGTTSSAGNSSSAPLLSTSQWDLWFYFGAIPLRLVAAALFVFSLCAGSGATSRLLRASVPTFYGRISWPLFLLSPATVILVLGSSVARGLLQQSYEAAPLSCVAIGLAVLLLATFLGWICQTYFLDLAVPQAWAFAIQARSRCCSRSNAGSGSNAAAAAKEEEAAGREPLLSKRSKGEPTEPPWPTRPGTHEAAKKKKRSGSAKAASSACSFAQWQTFACVLGAMLLVALVVLLRHDPNMGHLWLSGGQQSSGQSNQITAAGDQSNQSSTTTTLLENGRGSSRTVTGLGLRRHHPPPSSLQPE